MLLEYIADTVVFVVSGLIVSKVVWSGEIKAKDWGFLFLLYIALHIIRFLNVLMCWPVLKSKHGYGKKWDYKEMIVLVWSGLRGTVGLALALIAEDELRNRGKEGDDRSASLVVFFMAGIAFLTLVINGSLMTPIISRLKLDRVTTAEQDLFHHSCARVEVLLQNHVDEVLKMDLFLGDAQYQLVWRYVPVLSPQQYWDRIDSGKIHLAPNEVEDALAETREGRQRRRIRFMNDESSGNVCCPPFLRSTWDRYHRQFHSTPNPTKETPQLDIPVFSGAPPSPLSPRDNRGRLLEQQTVDLRKKLVRTNMQLKAHNTKVSRESERALFRDQRQASIEEEETSEEDALLKGRTRFMTAVRAQYVANQHMGRMQTRTLRYLRESADIQLDYAENRLHDW